ncbi:hypothetical protein N0V84_011382 [Fusarium piperis]|uniref:Rhodopsin domain-containing protein n=1 Tax=Fusarium piperis TaxID=1435070 RepID=A0A9W8TDH9_9HYPO|nr:hypothetical protein N0V84_011382 [Fusarium piperis]
MASEAASPGQARSGPKESRSDDVVIILTVMQALSTIVVAARLLTRLLIQHMRLAADDWSIIVSWVLLVAYTVDVCTQTKFGLGKHIGDLPPDTNFAASLELFYYGEALYYITVSLTKVSILFLYLRVFPQQNYRVFNICMMAFVIATGFSCTVAGIFQCNPIRRAWLTSLPGTCFNRVALFIANASLNIAQDLIIYILPIPMLWQVQRPLGQRLALIGIFVVGGFVCVTGMIRLKSLQVASISKDPTWDNYGAAVWSSIEANFGLICASLVHFKPLIKRFAPSLLGLSIRGSKGSKMVRLGDESSENPNSLKTFGQRQFNKPVGVLTQMELEDMEHSSRPNDAFGGSPPGYATASVGNKKPFQESQEHLQGINATTHIDISSYTTQRMTPGRAA